MKKLYTLLIALLFVGGTMGQGCLPDGISFYLQSQVDSFQFNYSGCTEIEGNVWIYGDITNLNGLNVLTSIGGDFQILDNYSLESLVGLENLASIGGDFRIGYMTMAGCYSPYVLTTLNGLQNLSAIGGDFYIECLDSVTNLSGLEGLVNIGGSFWIRSNMMLHDLGGLINLETIGGTLWIRGVPLLRSLEGLSNLVSVGGITISNTDSLVNLNGLENIVHMQGGFGIVGNDALESLDGLNNLKSIDGSMIIGNSSIGGNASLIHLNSLANVTSIGGFLWIQSNDMLTSLSGLDNIAEGTISEIEIIDNANLSECEVLSICNYLASPNGQTIIENNTLGCNSPEEVQDSCVTNAVTINEIKLQEQVLIYPNPTQSSITIELPTQPSKNTMLTLSNTNGQQLITQLITKPQTEIDISHLPNGIYFVKVWNEKDVMVQKAIKQ